MSIFKRIKESSAELMHIQALAVCAMMIALRVILGMFTNFTLAVVPFVKIGFSFIPVMIAAYLYGPVAAGLIHCIGDILSSIISNPTAFSLIPGITVCCFIEGFIYGMVLYKKEIKYKTIILAKVLGLFLCQLPLNTIFLSMVMGIPYFQLLLYRCAVLIPYAIVEVLLTYFMLKITNQIFAGLKKNNH